MLVVDDNQDAAVLLAASLSLQGFDVRTAGDAPEALKLVEEFTPAVAPLDIGLPGMDGFELAATLRQRDHLRETRLIALTGYRQQTDRERAARAGFETLLVKPVDLDQLYGLLPKRSLPDSL